MDARVRNGLILGAILGAVVGMGAAWLVMKGSESVPEEEKEPFRVKDGIRIVTDATNLIRTLDEVRRRA